MHQALHLGLPVIGFFIRASLAASDTWRYPLGTMSAPMRTEALTFDHQGEALGYLWLAKALRVLED